MGILTEGQGSFWRSCKQHCISVSAINPCSTRPRSMNKNKSHCKRNGASGPLSNMPMNFLVIKILLKWKYCLIHQGNSCMKSYTRHKAKKEKPHLSYPKLWGRFHTRKAHCLIAFANWWFGRGRTRTNPAGKAQTPWSCLARKPAAVSPASQKFQIRSYAFSLDGNATNWLCVLTFGRNNVFHQ